MNNAAQIGKSYKLRIYKKLEKKQIVQKVEPVKQSIPVEETRQTNKPYLPFDHFMQQFGFYYYMHFMMQMYGMQFNYNQYQY